MPKKMFALHKDESGNVLGAFEFAGDYDLSSKIRMLDLRDGDFVDFKEVAQRKSPEAEVQPAPWDEEPPRKAATEPVTPLIAVDEQPL